MKTFSIKEAYLHGWQVWKANWKATTVVGIIFFLTSLLQKMAPVLGILNLIVILWVLPGSIFTFLNMEDGGHPEADQVFAAGRYKWRYAGLVILYGLLMLAGFILLVIPGFYFLLTYSFAGTVLIDKDTKVREAFRQSALLTQGVKWKLLGLLLVGILLGILNKLTFNLASIVTIPLGMLVHVHVYRKLSQAA